MASAGTPSLVEESIAEEAGDVPSPENPHKPLLPPEEVLDEIDEDESRPTSSSDLRTSSSSSGRRTDARSNNNASFSPSASRAGQSSASFASGPKSDVNNDDDDYDDLECIPESPVPPNLNQNGKSLEAPPLPPSSSSSSLSPKHVKKKQGTNPRMKQLQLSPNKATDR